MFHDTNKINFKKITDNVSVDFNKQIIVMDDKLFINYEDTYYESGVLESEVNYVARGKDYSLFIAVQGRDLYRFDCKRYLKNNTEVYKVNYDHFIVNNIWYECTSSFDINNIVLITNKYIVYKSWYKYYLLYKNITKESSTIYDDNKVIITKEFMVLNDKLYKTNNSIINVINNLNSKLLNYILKKYVVQKKKSAIPF